MKKQIIYSLLIGSIILAFAGCGKKKGEQKVPDEANTSGLAEAIENMPGVPSLDKLEDCLGSFYTWAGLQSFYNGITFESIDDGVAVSMAAYTAQTLTSDYATDASGCYQIISKDEIKNAMRNLFGKEYDIANVSSDIQSKSCIEIKKDNLVYVQLGDWGLVVPKLEILSVDTVDESGDFIMNAIYYPYDVSKEERVTTTPTYVCKFICHEDENSEYGFIIKNMSASIVQ